MNAEAMVTGVPLSVRIEQALARVPLIALAMLAATLAALVDLAVDPMRLMLTTGDPDDAVRLIQVRDLLAGQGWYDLRHTRIGGAEPLVQHWSRLIDLPVAILILGFSRIVTMATAEWLTVIVWPTFLSGLMLFTVARFVDGPGRRVRAVMVIALAMLSSGYVQFAPGRIDHHNAMIIGAIGGLFLLLASFKTPRLGWLAGVALGLGLTVGLEAIVLTVVGLVLLALIRIVTGENLGGLARTGVALAVTLLFGWLLFDLGSPGGRIVCDALSVNLVMLAAGCAGGLVVAHVARSAGSGVPTTLVIAAVGGLVGSALYGMAEPSCLGGPYATVSPRLDAIWLAHVVEVQTFLFTLLAEPGIAIGMAGFPLAGLLYAVIMRNSAELPHGRAYLMLFAIAMALGLWQIRLLPYAGYLAVPLIVLGLTRETKSAPASAVAMPVAPRRTTGFLAQLDALGSRTRLIVGVGCLVTAGVLAIGVTLRVATKPVAVAAAAPAPVAPPTSSGTAKIDRTCTRRGQFAPLAVLEPGLAANDLNLGAALLLWTRLSITAAPYHRLETSILATHDLLVAPVAEAEARMRAMGARYIVLCTGGASTTADRPEPADALRRELMLGRAPAWLVPVPIAGTPVKVWRLAER